MKAIMKDFIKDVLTSVIESERSGQRDGKMELARTIFKRLSPLPDSADGKIFDITVDVVVIVLDLTNAWPADITDPSV